MLQLENDSILPLAVVLIQCTIWQFSAILVSEHIEDECLSAEFRNREEKGGGMGGGKTEGKKNKKKWEAREGEGKSKDSKIF